MMYTGSPARAPQLPEGASALPQLAHDAPSGKKRSGRVHGLPARDQLRAPETESVAKPRHGLGSFPSLL